jgi:hypothetical protein
MTASNSTRQKAFMKILIPMIVVLGVIIIAKAGYDFGQWLHQAVN